MSLTPGATLGSRFVVVEPQGELKGSGGIIVEENWSRELAQ